MMSAICHSCSFEESPLLPLESQTKDILELLRSNTLPSNSDILHFQNVASSMPLELARYDEQILRLTTELKGIVLQRKQLQTYGARCASASSPIRRLPNELLVGIFAECSEESDLSGETTPYAERCRVGKRDLCQLSQVCVSWNEVVLNAPMLWSTIAVNFDCWVESPTSRVDMSDILKTTLERGGQFPLAISIRATSRKAKHKSSLELLCQHSKRWRQVLLQMHLSRLSLLLPVRDHLPLLERLEIAGPARQLTNWPKDLDIFATAPKLTVAEINVGGTVLPIPQRLIPWGQLTWLSITDVALHDLPKLLPIFAHLQIGARLELNMAPSVFWLPAVPHVSAMSKVSCLRLALDDEHAVGAVGNFLDSLTLPHARELDFSVYIGCSAVPWNQRSFAGFAVRSALRETLTVLDFERLLIKDTELLECLLALPLLELLSISDAPQAHTEHILITTNLLHRLTLLPETPAFVPRLHTFRITSLFQFDSQAYIQLVRSRTSSERVFTASTRWFSDCEPDVLPDMSALQIHPNVKFSSSAVDWCGRVREH